MNLILNREINGFSLSDEVRIVAAMNPEDMYDYQTVDMDPAQQNRFVWLQMHADYMQWIDWALEAGIESKVIEFIAAYPEYLNQRHDADVDATPRSYERISHLYSIYKNTDQYSRDVFLNVIRGNVGKLIGESFLHFVESEQEPLLDFDDVLAAVKRPGGILSLSETINNDSPTRLYMSAKNMLHRLDYNATDEEVQYFVELLELYPRDLRIAIMKDMRNVYKSIYEKAKEHPRFVESFFEAHR